MRKRRPAIMFMLWRFIRASMDSASGDCVRLRGIFKGEIMTCFDLPEGLAQCVTKAMPWLQLAAALMGLGTFALIAFLFRIANRYSDANDTLTKAYNEAVTDKQAAQTKLNDTNRQLGATQYQLELCQAVKSGENSELSQKLQTALAENQKLQSRLALVRSMTNGGDAGFWSRPPLPDRRMKDYDHRLETSIPILLFAAQKGGVGKSTLTTNLAAAFAESGKRVLAVDMDYQGTTSAQMVRESELRLGENTSRIDHLLMEQMHDRWVTEILQIRANLHLIPASYSLEVLERREEYRWAIDEAGDDVRYRLARALLSDYVKQNFDIVLIDAPPRMTLGFLNGFCTATHIFVPTVVDYASARAVGHFARQFCRLVPAINPLITFAGIIGTLTNKGPRLPNVNSDVANTTEDEVQKAFGDKRPYFIREAVMTRSAPLAAATDSGIAYWQVPETQSMFNELAKIILARANGSKP
jgi:chromosome partitioning protein